MKIGELTAELDLRGIDYSDCIDGRTPSEAERCPIIW